MAFVKAKIGAKVRHTRRNGEVVNGVVVNDFDHGLGRWLEIRVGKAGAAGTYTLKARPSQLEKA